MVRAPGRRRDALVQGCAQTVGVVVQQALEELDLEVAGDARDLVAQRLAGDDDWRAGGVDAHRSMVAGMAGGGDRQVAAARWRFISYMLRSACEQELFGVGQPAVCSRCWPAAGTSPLLGGVALGDGRRRSWP